jgi:hypothetical protein
MAKTHKPTKKTDKNESRVLSMHIIKVISVTGGEGP